MTIKKQEFYEGAALHLIARSAGPHGVRVNYDSPFFILNDELRIYFKYTTGGRSPWSFSFTAAEQHMLAAQGCPDEIVVALICGEDGVAALTCSEFFVLVAEPHVGAVHLGCFRLHGEHYEVRGPNGRLARKVPPSKWQRLLSARGEH